MQGNNGPVLHSRAEVINIIDTMNECSTADMFEICKFFLKLKPTCDKQATEGKQVLYFFARFGLQENYPQYHQVVQGHIDQILTKAVWPKSNKGCVFFFNWLCLVCFLKARQGCKGINQDILSWLTMNLDLVTLVLDGAALHKIRRCPQGQWASVAPELSKVVTTSLGRELFLKPHQRVLEEIVQQELATGFQDWVRSAPVVDEATCRQPIVFVFKYIFVLFEI